MESAWKQNGLPKPLRAGEVSSGEATMTERFSGGKSMQRTEKYYEADAFRREATGRILAVEPGKMCIRDSRGEERHGNTLAHY